MAKKNHLWCYSLNGEDYRGGTYSSAKAALVAASFEAAAEGEPVKFLYVAKAEPQENRSFFPDGGDVIEHMVNQADDVGGDYVNNYPDVTDEAERDLTVELHALLEKWCEKYGVSPSFYTVSEPVVYDAVTLKVTKKKV